MTDPTEDTLTEAPAVADTSPEESADVDAESPATAEGELDATDAQDADDTADELTPDEREKGYLRQADYTRKAQEVAEARRALEAQRAEFERVRDTRLQQADQAINLAARTLQADFAKVDWNTLAQTDPAGYVQKQHEFAVRQAELGQAWQTLQAQQAEKDRETQTTKAYRLAEQESALLDAIPEWRDPAKRAAEVTEIRKFANSVGIDDDTLAWVSENGTAGMVQALRDAMLYRRVKQQLPKAKPVPAAPPPPPKVSSKSAARFDPEKGSMDDFVRWREKQLKERYGRR